MNDEPPKTQHPTPSSATPPPLSPSPPQRHLAIRILGWIVLIIGALMAASGAAQIVMGMIYAPPVVGLILGLLIAIGGLSMARSPRKQKR